VSAETPSPAESPDAPDIRVTSGDPSATELAALTAVLSAAVDAAAGVRRRAAQQGSTAWQRSQRDVRRPLVVGAWSTFGR
jgi:hypothetical protein